MKEEVHVILITCAALLLFLIVAAVLVIGEGYFEATNIEACVERATLTRQECMELYK